VASGDVGKILPGFAVFCPLSVSELVLAKTRALPNRSLTLMVRSLNGTELAV
jgi:hypothetical protein